MFSLNEFFFKIALGWGTFITKIEWIRPTQPTCIRHPFELSRLLSDFLNLSPFGATFNKTFVAGWLTLSEFDEIDF